MQDDTLSSTATTLLAYAAPLLGYVLVRAFAVRAMLRYMNQRTGADFGAAPLPVAAVDASTVASGGATPASAPSFRVFQVTDRVRLDAASEQIVSRALWSSPRALGWFFLALLIYGCVFFFAGQYADAAQPQRSWSPAVILGTLAFVMLFVVLGRFSALQQLDPWPLLALGALLTGVSFTAPVSRPLGLTAAGLAVGLMAQWFVRQRRAQNRYGDLSLLVLRVFNADRNTVSVFGRLMAAWQYLGTHFTVADPSYIRYQLSLSSARARMLLMRALLAMTLLSFVVWVLTNATLPIGTPLVDRWQALDSELRRRVVTSLLWFLLIPLAAFLAVRQVRRRFIATPAMLAQRLQEATGPRAWTDETFRAAPLFCPDNVWQPAVHALLGSAHAVVMDLRGFSSARRGCEYEIGALVDRLPLSRVLFLVDGGPALEGVKAVIQERWAAMSAASPNRGVTDTEIRLFQSEPGDPRDVPQILRLLVLAARADATPPTQLVSVTPAKARWAITRWLTRMLLFFGTLNERLSTSLDMLVARPTASTGAAVALALGAVVPLAWQVKAALEAPPRELAAPGEEMPSEMPFWEQARLGDAPPPAVNVAELKELPVKKVSHQSDRLCGDAVYGSASNEHTALVALTFQGEALRGASHVMLPELAPKIVVNNREIVLSDDFFMPGTRWRPVGGEMAFGGGARDDSTICIDLTFKQPVGVFPVTVTLAGSLPVKFSDGSVRRVKFSVPGVVLKNCRYCTPPQAQ